LSVTVTDAWGLSTTQTIPIEVDNTTNGKLYTNEYWYGPVTLDGMVEIPSGLGLTLDSVQGEVYGTMDDNEVMQGGIVVDSGGSMQVSNTGTSSVFDTYVSGTNWKGFLVNGTLGGSGLELDHAERACVLFSGSSISVSQLSLKGNLIGLHLLGGSLFLDDGSVAGNIEYGMKEDSSGSYSIKNMTFTNNGVDYYRAGVAGITIPELNAIAGNGGNK
jgi:hypothetical protein